MASQKNLYPSLDLCDMCKWKINRYHTVDTRCVSQRNKICTKLGNENNAAKGKICFSCGVKIPEEKKLVEEKCIVKEPQNHDLINEIFKIKLPLIFVSVIILATLIFYFKPKVSGNILDSELPKLMNKYPNQSPELWQNVLKITNATKPAVHVLILLYKDNSEVAECFAKDLVALINKIIEKDGLLIYKEKNEVNEYGVELSHYLKEVSKHKHLIVLQLNKMSGDKARMFHVLCDDAPFSIRPSYLIFTVEDGTKDRTTEVRRPLARAVHILRSAWSNLMENELHPLMSRVVRNVAEILPEKNLNCHQN